MESVYKRFDSYDFDSDTKFQEGLKLFHRNNKNSSGGGEDKLKDMMLFFYDRFVEPIDQSGYRQWSSTSPPVTLKNSRTEPQDEETPMASDCDGSKGRADVTSVGAEVTQLSFAEVMQCIQEGREIPGVKKLDITPSNQNPTPSQMERIHKPWERDLSPK